MSDGSIRPASNAGSQSDLPKAGKQVAVSLDQRIENLFDPLKFYRLESFFDFNKPVSARKLTEIFKSDNSDEQMKSVFHLVAGLPSMKNIDFANPANRKRLLGFINEFRNKQEEEPTALSMSPGTWLYMALLAMKAKTQIKRKSPHQKKLLDEVILDSTKTMIELVTAMKEQLDEAFGEQSVRDHIANLPKQIASWGNLDKQFANELKNFFHLLDSVTIQDYIANTQMAFEAEDDSMWVSSDPNAKNTYAAQEAIELAGEINLAYQTVKSTLRGFLGDGFASEIGVDMKAQKTGGTKHRGVLNYLFQEGGVVPRAVDKFFTMPLATDRAVHVSSNSLDPEVDFAQYKARARESVTQVADLAKLGVKDFAFDQLFEHYGAEEFEAAIESALTNDQYYELIQGFFKQSSIPGILDFFTDNGVSFDEDKLVEPLAEVFVRFANNLKAKADLLGLNITAFNRYINEEQKQAWIDAHDQGENVAIFNSPVEIKSKKDPLNIQVLFEAFDKFKQKTSIEELNETIISDGEGDYSMDMSQVVPKALFEIFKNNDAAPDLQDGDSISFAAIDDFEIELDSELIDNVIEPSHLDASCLLTPDMVKVVFVEANDGGDAVSEEQVSPELSPQLT